MALFLHSLKALVVLCTAYPLTEGFLNWFQHLVVTPSPRVFGQELNMCSKASLEEDRGQFKRPTLPHVKLFAGLGTP